jgi:O-antigen/teichoic acid export membrane protein
MIQLKQLGKDTIVYGIGGILAQSVSFFTIPVFTRVFTPSEYGVIEMIVAVNSFLAAVIVMGMDSAQSMFFFKHKEDGKQAQSTIISAILQWRLFFGVSVVIIATLATPLLSSFFFDGKLTWEYFAISFSSILFVQVLNQSADVMRLLYRPWGYISITLLQSVLSAGLIILFVVVLEKGILGYLIGSMLSAFIVAIFGCYKIRSYMNFGKIHIDWWPRLLRFGFPLLPAGLAMYFMNTSDRWFINYYHGEEALGLFSIGAKFSLVMALIVETFRKAWWPIAMDSMYTDNGQAVFRLIGRIYIGLGSVAILSLTIISPWLVQFMTGPKFHSAWPIVGVMSWQSLFYGFFLIASIGIWKAEKTYLNLYLMGGAAIIGVLLNWVLVPKFGAMGSAIANVLTYIVWIVSSLVLSERYWKVSFNVGTMALQLGVAFAYEAWIIFACNGQLGLLEWVLFVLVSSFIIISSVPKNGIEFLLNKIRK